MTILEKQPALLGNKYIDQVGRHFGSPDFLAWLVCLWLTRKNEKITLFYMSFRVNRRQAIRIKVQFLTHYSKLELAEKCISMRNILNNQPVAERENSIRGALSAITKEAMGIDACQVQQIN